VPALLNLRDLLPPAVKAHVYVAAGERESGKSYFARYLLGLLTADGTRRGIVHVVQPEARYPGLEVRSVAEAEAHLDAGCLVFRYVDFDAVARFVINLRTVEPDREIVIVIDEVTARDVSHAGEWTTPQIGELLHVTRKVTAILSTQTIADCPVELRELADGGMFLFRMRAEPGSGTRARLVHDGVSPRLIAELPTLPDRECLHSGRSRPPAP
jgi:hypothetical protein